MEYMVEQVELVEQQAGVVAGQVQVEQMAEFLGGAFGEVLGALSAQGMTVVGHPFAVYSPPGPDGFQVMAGFPASGAVAPTGRVVPFVLPGGPGLRVLHVGAYDQVVGAYHALEAYMAQHALAPSGPPSESYLDGPEVAEPRTLVVWPVRPA